MAVIAWGKPTVQVAAYSAQGVAPQKTFVLVKSNATGDTTIEIAKGSGVTTGDVIGYKNKAVACTNVNTTNTTKDVVTVTMGVEIPNGAILYEAAAASASAAVDKATWVTLTPIKQNTTKLTSTKGNKTEAKEEGGGVVDVKYDKNAFSLEFEVYVTKGATKPIADDDGTIVLNYAVRVIPEDPEIAGYLMDKAFVQVEENFGAADGATWKYAFDGLIPATGKICKPFVSK